MTYLIEKIEIESESYPRAGDRLHLYCTFTFASLKNQDLLVWFGYELGNRFKAYPWTAVPSYTQIGQVYLDFLEMQKWKCSRDAIGPQPFKWVSDSKIVIFPVSYTRFRVQLFPNFGYRGLQAPASSSTQFRCIELCWLLTTTLITCHRVMRARRAQVAERARSMVQPRGGSTYDKECLPFRV